jgi:hypothetical protein
VRGSTLLILHMTQRGKASLINLGIMLQVSCGVAPTHDEACMHGALFLHERVEQRELWGLGPGAMGHGGILAMDTRHTA